MICKLVKASAQSPVSKCISQAMLVRSCGALHQLLGSTNNCERKTDAELIGDFSLNVANVAGLCESKGMLVASTHIPKAACALLVASHVSRAFVCFDRCGIGWMVAQDAQDSLFQKIQENGTSDLIFE